LLPPLPDETAHETISGDLNAILAQVLRSFTIRLQRHDTFKGERVLAEVSPLEFEIKLDGIYTIDIVLVDRGISEDFQSRKLMTIGAQYDVPFIGTPHNAGNNAVYTMEVFLGMSAAMDLSLAAAKE
jgi:hypothetical protein